MKLDPRISAELARLEPNQIGVMAWSLMPIPPQAAFPASQVPMIPGPTSLKSLANLLCLTNRLPPLWPDFLHVSPMVSCSTHWPYFLVSDHEDPAAFFLRH